MLKRFYSLTLLLLCGIMTSWAADVTYSPVLDVNFRTAAGNTAWQTVKDAADDGNTDFELTSTAGFFALQKYQVADLQSATKLVLTLTVGSKAGVDAVRLWSLPMNDWTATSGIDDIYPNVKAAIGIDLRATEGTPNEPLVKAAKVAGSDPAKATLTITGTALATIKANATADGTFTLLLTNDNLTNSGNKRSYLSNNTANDEANRPTLVATIETPTVKNVQTGVTYSNLTDAFTAAVSAGADAELEVYEDVKLSGRLTLNKAMTLTITPKKDITIKGAPGTMWFLANVNDAVLNVGGSDYTITLDGENKAYTGKDVAKYENSAVISLTNVTFQNFDLNNVGHLVGSKANEGQIILDRVTFKNCKNPGDAFIYKARVTNDRLVLKGWLNQESCTGTTVYAASETKASGTTGRIKIDDADFTANAPITINWPGTKAEGIVVVIGTKGANADKFQLTDKDWKLVRKASNGDLYMAKAGWLDFVQGSFTHPGLLHTAADITRVKANLSVEPFKSAYAQLEAVSGGTAAGAVEYLKRLDATNWGPSGSKGQYSDYANYTHAATDARLAYELALRYQLKGSTTAATQAVSILNNWATVNKGVLRLDGYTNNIPDPNEYLILIQAYQFANAAELLRDYTGWQAADFTAFKSWMRETFGQLAYEFLETHHGNANALHYWLNWDLAALNALYSVGVLCDDQALVDYALNYIDNGTGTGNKAKAIVATHQDPDSPETLAQCQESGRDQGHSTLDVTLLGVLCQTAQNQGTDLFTAYKALEMAEYVGKYNLKDASGNFIYAADKVPFTTYNNGEVNHTAISSEGRGTVRPSWELFHAYARNNNKSDIYTKQWVEYMRQQNAYGEAEGTSTDELGFGTLMFGAEETPDVVPAITVTVKAASREYGAANPTFEYEVTDGTKEQLGGDIEITCEATATSAVGEYAVKATKGTATYSNIVFVNGTLTITKAPLTVKAKSYTIKQGEALPTFEAEYAGFKNSETSAVLTVQPTLSTTATSASAPGTYDITVSGAEAKNYEITYQNGTLTIEETTGIKAVRTALEGKTVYDLNGRKVDTPTKGLYIVGGKKIMMK